MPIIMPKVVTTSLLPKASSITSSKALLGFYLKTEEGTELKFPVDKLTNVVGRDTECDIILEGQSVSRRHCLLELTPRGLRIRDLGSKNGTLVNATLITEAFVTPGDIICLGHMILSVQKETSAI